MVIASAFFFAVAGCEKAEEPGEETETREGPPVSGVPASSTEKGKAAAERAVKFLVSHANPDGGFGTFKGGPASSVGVTALVATALIKSPLALTEETSPVLKRAIEFIVSNAQDSGAIAVPRQGLENYHTSAAVMTLVATGNDAYKPLLDKAEKFLRDLQLNEGEGLTPDNPFYGGTRYNEGARASDLSNTSMTIDAMKALGVEPDDPFFQKALVFVKRVTNNPEVNDMEWAKEVHEKDFGSGVYRPAKDPMHEDVDISKAGRRGKGWRGYGSMTYAMFKSFIAAGVKRDDPAVRGALSWIKNNYTLEENPGIGDQGRYYYYRMFARALKAWGEKEVGGHDWAADLIDTLAGLQGPDGSWVNTAGRWMETDPVLVTGYALEALSIALEQLEGR